MGRTVAIVESAAAMGDYIASRLGLAPGTGATAAPGPGAKRQLLHTARHLIRADMYMKLSSLSSSGRVCAGELRRGVAARLTTDGRCVRRRVTPEAARSVAEGVAP